MKTTYASNYMRIYLWQAVSLLAGFLAIFIVIPKLASIPAIYGVYSICMSVMVFFVYADIGFMGAGYKYASEKFAVNNLEEEIRIVGFVSFILFVFVLLFSAATLIFAVNPHLLIKGLSNQNEAAIASKLFLILALFSPIIILQRSCQIIFGIRLEDYVYQRFYILANLARIASVFYFFRGTKYDIVGYFLFFQIVGLASNVLYVFIIKKRYHYDLRLLAKSFRFSTELYNKTKKLALGSFFSTLLFILFYELDLFAIGRLSGAEMAGFYAIGLTLMTFFRGIMGALYGPFSARFNHFMGVNDMEGLKKILYNVIVLTLPLIVFPIVSMIMLMKSIVICWVGAKYTISIVIAQFLIMSFMYNFFVQPAGILMTARVNIKAMLTISLVMVIIYWAGILTTFSSIGILAFAIFKFVAFTISAIFYFIFIAEFLHFKPINLLKKIIAPAVIPVLFLIVMLAYVNRFMPIEKNKIDLLGVVATGGLASFMALCLYYASSAYFREYVNNVLVKPFKALA